VGNCRCDLMLTFCRRHLLHAPAQLDSSFIQPLLCSCTLASASHSQPWCLLSAHGSCMWRFVLQELYFRRNLEGSTDWQWSYDALVWFDTDDLAQVGPNTFIPGVPGATQSLVFGYQQDSRHSLHACYIVLFMLTHRIRMLKCCLAFSGMLATPCACAASSAAA
jgi:hypothetical protein